MLDRIKNVIFFIESFFDRYINFQIMEKIMFIISLKTKHLDTMKNEIV